MRTRYGDAITHPRCRASYLHGLYNALQEAATKPKLHIFSTIHEECIYRIANDSGSSGLGAENLAEIESRPQLGRATAWNNVLSCGEAVGQRANQARNFAVGASKEKASIQSTGILSFMMIAPSRLAPLLRNDTVV